MKFKFRILSFITVIALGLSIMPNAGATVLKGDVNGDGVVASDDVRLILGYASGVLVCSEDQFFAADFDSDGDLDNDDVRGALSLIPNADNNLDILLAKGFPISYAEPLAKLQEKYPNWNFEPMITGLDWQTAVNNERQYGQQNVPHTQQLIEKNVQASFICSCSVCYGKTFEGGGWVSASEEAVKYYMDPRNFLTEKYIFQFESTFYDERQTVEGVEAILKGTWMYYSKISYLDGWGNTVIYTDANGYQPTYSEMIMGAAEDSGMGAYYLASKIVQEVGASSSQYAGGASGTNYPYYGIYNYYNIGANTGVADGLNWANGYMSTSRTVNLYAQPNISSNIVVSIPQKSKLYYLYTDGDFYGVRIYVNGTEYQGYVHKDNVSVSTTYNRPWTNPAVSIYNGAMWIKDGFEKQFTGYLQKFNVNPESSNIHGHEYMANVRAAASEALKTYKAYADMDNLGEARTFYIPVFYNMPGENVSADEVFVTQKPSLYLSSTTGTSVTMGWSSVSGSEGYEVYSVQNGYYTLLYNTADLSFTDYIPWGETRSYVVWGYKTDTNGSIIYTVLSDVLTLSYESQVLTGTVKVNDLLNVRSGPGTGYDRIAQLSNGTRVTILETLDGWYKISTTLNGQTLVGYCSSDYIVV